MVHVQQRTDDEAMWNLYPSFVLKWLDPENCSISPDIGHWQYNFGQIKRETEKQGSLSPPVSVHSILEQLQEQYPSFGIKQKFNRYCSLTGDEVSEDGLICSIPVLVLENKVLVDHLAFSRKSGCLHNLPWTQIYSPTRVEQVIGNSSVCSSLLQWLQLWSGKCHKNSADGASSKRKLQCENSDPDFLPTKYSCERDSLFEAPLLKESLLPAALLHGPHGSGKTAAVYACAAESGFKVFEINSSSLRSKSQLLHKLKEVTLSQRVQPWVWTSKKPMPSVSLCCNTVILFDEIDVVFHEDRGFLQAVQEIISSTRCPIVLTCSAPILEFNAEVLMFQFCLPSELELAIHLSLLSLANGWPLSLKDSQLLSRYFHGDIRKAILHLQVMLSWQPSDPRAPFSCALHDSVGDSSTCSLPLNTQMYWPWRNSASNHSSFNSPSYLELISLLNDRKSEVDCIQCSLSYESQKVKPSLLDELPEKSSFCPVGEEIINSISQLLYADCTRFTVVADRKWDSILDNFFSKCWQLRQIPLVTECIPLLRWMFEHEELRKGAESRMRQSRHYFHPHHLKLREWFSAERL